MTEQCIPSDAIRLTIPSNPKYLRALRALIEEVTYGMGFGEEVRAEVVHAVNEACTNVITHSYKGDYTKEIIVSLAQKEDRLEIAIRDFGAKPVAEFIRHRDLRDVRPGGLGVFFIRRHMDEVRYDTSPPVGTVLRMVKYIGRGGDDRGASGEG